MQQEEKVKQREEKERKLKEKAEFERFRMAGVKTEEDAPAGEAAAGGTTKSTASIA